MAKESLHRLSWAPQETASQLLRIPSYLRLISASKLLLGLLVVTLVAVVIVMPLMNREESGMRVVLSQIPITNVIEKPRMINPTFESVDSSNQPFTIRAKEAVQEDSESVKLFELKADIALNSGNWLALQAEEGILQIEKQKLLLQGNVHLFSDDGNEFRTQRLLVNLATGDVWGPVAVQGQGAEVPGSRTVHTQVSV
jgi:lipopolysaccharide export system protein LptC